MGPKNWIYPHLVATFIGTRLITIIFPGHPAFEKKHVRNGLCFLHIHTYTCLKYAYIYIYIYIYLYLYHIFTCILEKTQINAHLRDFCFLSGFFLHMSVITPLLACLHFVHFETKIISVFSWEISVNTRENNTRPSRNKCAFSSSSEHKKSERT